MSGQYGSSKHQSVLKTDEGLPEVMRKDFMANRRIPKSNFMTITLCCWRPKVKRYRQLLQKSRSRVTKEMDLQKFLYRQRVCLTAVLGLLTRRQSIFVDRFS